jgi:hypothetical protein
VAPRRDRHPEPDPAEAGPDDGHPVSHGLFLPNGLCSRHQANAPATGRNVRPGLERTFRRGHRTTTRAGRRTGAGLSTDKASISQSTSQTAMLASARVAGGPPVAISTGTRTAMV